MTVRPANISDLQSIMTILDAAKSIMRSDGNTEQWSGAYPSVEVILHDIENSYGYVITDSSRVVAYFAFIPSPEPTYACIYNGAWLDDTLPYHVIHRIASFPEAHGIFSTIMDWSFSQDRNIRIDTHRANRIMQHNLLKHGFTYCGIIYLASGDERLAYQKLLP